MLVGAYGDARMPKLAPQTLNPLARDHLTGSVSEQGGPL